MTGLTPEATEQRDERDQASAALAAAITRLATAIGLEQAARVLGSVAVDLQAELTKRTAADVLASERARQAGGLH